MTYVVNESCIRCKTMDCVEVCPVDCFYEGENMLVRVTSQREIENLVRSGEVKGGKLKLRMPLSAEVTPLKHVVEETVAL